DFYVTGVQTCALPIYLFFLTRMNADEACSVHEHGPEHDARNGWARELEERSRAHSVLALSAFIGVNPCQEPHVESPAELPAALRSEERRVVEGLSAGR